MKKLLCVLIIVILMFAIVGCAKIIDTKTETVEATIIDVDYDPMWLQPIRSGKVTTIITHPADYDICLKYKDIEEWIDVNSSEYDTYKNLVGTSIKVSLITNYYDDGTIKQHIELIGE